MLKCTQVALVLFLLCFPIYAVGAESYVSSTNGTDIIGCGSLADPCKSVSQAMNTGGTNVIKIANGTYLENATTAFPIENLTFQGGWNETFTSQSCESYETILKPFGNTGNILTVTASSGKSISVNVECMRKCI